MYLEHFGFAEQPFSLTPDTGFFYRHPGQQEALNVLLVALATGEGFIKIVGEVGTGKTLLCRRLLDSLGEDCVTAYLPNPLLSPRQLHQAVADELGIEFRRDATVQELLKCLAARLVELSDAGRQVVLCIDEAQAMSDESLEALRLLSNLETEKRKLLHIVLFAQPELDERLAGTGLRQLRQRITFGYRLEPLNREDVAGYVAHRLRVAGCPQQIFTRRAIDRLFRASRGVPRLVNILCHKSLLAAFGRGEATIDLAPVRAAVADTPDAALGERLSAAPMVWGLALTGALILAGLALVARWALGGMP
ncbi:MSHA biogenesis protein MshM [Desulfuromonas versatilis]|uniref:MSHA biogenesis protein MshM n=1 Tax=Desulfuromonas versatilis TaxID=2802975 RepID=A0ABM8I0Q9_9BACT|nr:AAA family ATPase [Desulfuromonas versatilis]BCR06404.1 MSHA biogenesis protein MshM [Desulfuromonas versatilis]